MVKMILIARKNVLSAIAGAAMFLIYLTSVHVHALGWADLSLKGLSDFFIKIIGGVLIPIAIAVVFLMFVYGIVKYLHAANTGSKSMVDEAKNRLLYPLLAILILFTLWGIVEILRILFTRG